MTSIHRFRTSNSAGSVNKRYLVLSARPADVWLAAILITATFYTVPLSRFELAGTDFRLFDFVFAFFTMFVGLRLFPLVKKLFNERGGVFYWAGWLLVLVWGSLIFTILLSGWGALGPGIVRAVRFTAYFFVGAFLVVVARKQEDVNFLLMFFYLNILLQAILAIVQGLGFLGSFWPSYYLANYGFRPVGTLSAHHKQIGIVMLLGLGVSLAYLRMHKNIFRRIFILVGMGLMIAATFFVASRTSWLGLAGLVLGIFLVHRMRSPFIILPVAIGLIIIFLLTQAASGDLIGDLLRENIDSVLFDRLDRQGIEGIVGDRLRVYDNFPDAVLETPWILITGTGFQNIRWAIGATGAHNNYVQPLFELGIVGFYVYMSLLFAIPRTLKTTSEKFTNSDIGILAQDARVVFVAILVTMLVGESFWGQTSMQTLTAQIMILIGLASAPYFWEGVLKPYQIESKNENPLPSPYRRFRRF